MLTARDLEVVDFIHLFKAATSDQIKKIFFPSMRTTNRSLLRIMKSKQFKNIKRERFLFSPKYVYYRKNKTQVIHNLLITEFYVLLKTCNKGSLVEFKTPYSILGYFPDCFVRYRIDNLEYLFFVEVQTSNSDLNFKKYEYIYQNHSWEEEWGVFPRIIIISDKNINIHSKLNFIQIKTDYKDWEVIFNEEVR